MIVAAVLLSTTAVAQPDKDWWACQVVHAWGINWANNQWMTENLRPSAPFVLMSDGNGSLTKESVKKAFDSTVVDSGVECKDWNYQGYVSCMDVGGAHLYFSKETGKGGLSLMSGSTTTDTDYRDTLSVEAFECSKG